MKYTQQNGGVFVSGVIGFSLAHTLECGQCFRAHKLSENKYSIIAHGRILTIEQSGESFFFEPTNISEFENIWVPYFDLERDYGAIGETLAANDFVMRDAVEYAPGIRILKQDFFECLISFIISQNNRIPMIRQVVDNISEAFGKSLGVINDKERYSFPSLDILSQTTDTELRALKTGFRDKYIIDACRKLSRGEIDPESFDRMNASEIRLKLMSINGVGQKVADCVMLFSLARHETFPTDVWIKRIMQHFYFDGQAVSIKEIHELAEKKYGSYAGFAQEYLFHYARQFQIGK